MSAREPFQEGFTLMEVLVVLLLMSMLMGIGVGAFSKVGGGLELARKANSVTGLGWKLVGCWHFEEAVGGNSKGFPVDAAVDQSQIAPSGIIGNCLDLNIEANPGITIPSMSSFNTTTGISIELFVHLSGPGKRNLIAKGEFYSLAVDDDGRLRARLKVRSATASKLAAIEDYEICTDDYTLPLGEWIKVALHFNGYTCTLTAEGIVREEEIFAKRKQLATDQSTPIVVGNVKDPFAGFVDELRIGIAVTGDEMILPEAVSLAKGVGRVYFDRDGRLDRSHHTAPVEIVLDHEDSRPSRLTVGLFGEIW